MGGIKAQFYLGLFSAISFFVISPLFRQSPQFQPFFCFY